jgi:hypothetical protein
MDFRSVIETRTVRPERSRGTEFRSVDARPSTSLGQNISGGSLPGFPRCLLCALLLAACSTTQVLSKAEARELGTRTWEGETDEVFDATWLTLAARGYTIADTDRVAGTLLIKRGPNTWDVDIAAVGTEQRVELTPRHQSTRAELSALLDELEAGTGALLRAWRELPEWKYDGRRNLVSLPGFAVAPPREWEWLDFDLSRRLVTVQQFRARTGVNPTLVIEIDRRRPEPRLRASLQRAAGLTLGARQRLVLPDELEDSKEGRGLGGTMGVLDGTVPREVSWHAYEAVLGSSDVRLVMVCPLDAEAACTRLWSAVMRSVVQ